MIKGWAEVEAELPAAFCHTETSTLRDKSRLIPGCIGGILDVSGGVGEHSVPASSSPSSICRQPSRSVINESDFESTQTK